MPVTTRCLVLLFAALCRVALAATAGTPLFQGFDPEAYGADGLNTDIAVHADGRVFVANYDGLLHFNGAEWQVLALPGGRIIRSVEVGGDGRIYVGGPGHVGVVETRENGTLSYSDIGSELGFTSETGASAEQAIILSASDGVWIHAGDRLWHRAYGSGVHHEQALVPGTRNFVVSGDEVYARVRTHGLMKRVGDTWVAVPGAQAIGTDGINTAHPWKDGLLVVGGDAFYLIEPDGMRKLEAPMPPELQEPYFKPSLLTADGELLIGASTGEVFRFDRDLRLVQRIALGGRHIVRSLAADPDGGVWIATEGGLARLPPHVAWSRVDGPVGFGAAIVDFESHRGALWVGTSKGLLRLWTDDGMRLQPESIAGPDDAVYGIRSTAAGLLYARAGSLHALDGGTGPRTLLTEQHAYIRLVPTAHGSLRTYAVGRRKVWMLEVTDGRWVMAGEWEAEDAERWRDAVVMPQGDLWFGSSIGGPVRFRTHPSTGAPMAAEHFGAQHGLHIDGAGSRVHQIDGELIVAAGGRAVRWDGARFVDAGIAQPTQGWGSVEQALSLKNRQYLVTRRQLLLRSEAGDRWEPVPIEGSPRLSAARVGSDGVLRILTQAGALLEFDANQLPPRAQDPLPIALTSIRLRKPDGSSTHLPLPSTNAPLRVDVGSALELTWGVGRADAGTQYRVRVDGITAGWTSWQDTPRAETQLVRPGHFTLVIDARMRSGRAVLPSTLHLHVLPAWHQLLWVRIAGWLFLAGAAGGAILRWIRWRTQRYLKRARTLEAKVQERTQELERANRKLAELSVEDPLTGVANRRALERALHREWDRCAGARQPLAVLMIDVDHFKQYNDAHGHIAGDAVLRAVADTLSANVVAPRELLARFGGEEFAFLMPGTSVGDACASAERIRSSIAAAHRGVTVSIGAAIWVPHASCSPMDLVNAADQALYTAKRNGRNRVEIADGGMHSNREMSRTRDGTESGGTRSPLVPDLSDT